MDHRDAVTLTDGTITLRPWSRDEAGIMAEAFADPAIRRYNGGADRQGRPDPPLSIAGAETVIAEFEARWQEFAQTRAATGVAFAVVESASGRVVGCCGVDEWSKADVAQIGYWMVPDGRRRGHATRAAILLTRWLFELGAARVFLTVVAGNESSVGVARRAGFMHEGTMRAHAVWQGRRYDVLWFAALADEWAGGAPSDQR